MNELLELKGSLKNIKSESDLIERITSELQENFKDLKRVKLNVDLINQICNAIENSNLKVNKKELFIKIYSRSFGQLDAKEQEFISNVIDYLHEGGKIKSRTVLSFLYRWIKRMLSKN
jgi:hypothetical protein